MAILQNSTNTLMQNAVNSGQTLAMQSRGNTQDLFTMIVTRLMNQKSLIVDVDTGNSIDNFFQIKYLKSYEKANAWKYLNKVRLENRTVDFNSRYSPKVFALDQSGEVPLRNYGLTYEVIDQILAESGNDIRGAYDAIMEQCNLATRDEMRYLTMKVILDIGNKPTIDVSADFTAGEPLVMATKLRNAFVTARISDNDAMCIVGKNVFGKLENVLSTKYKETVTFRDFQVYSASLKFQGIDIYRMDEDTEARLLGDGLVTQEDLDTKGWVITSKKIIMFARDANYLGFKYTVLGAGRPVGGAIDFNAQLGGFYQTKIMDDATPRFILEAKLTT